MLAYIDAGVRRVAMPSREALDRGRASDGVCGDTHGVVYDVCTQEDGIFIRTCVRVACVRCVRHMHCTVYFGCVLVTYMHVLAS